MPEYLEYRYSATARSLMAFFMMVAYVFVALAAVLYSGALAQKSIFDIDLVKGIWLIGILAGAYTIDLLQKQRSFWGLNGKKMSLASS